MSRRKVNQAKELSPINTKNSKILPNRYFIFDHIPKGGIWGEVGVAFGDFSKVMLERGKPDQFHAMDLFNLHEQEIVFGLKSSDALDGKSHEVFFSDRFSTEIALGQVVINKGFSTDVLAQFEDEHFDLLYIDAAHDYDNVKSDLDIAKSKIKHDGIIIMNDYVLSNPFDGQLYGVVQATNELCVDEGWEIIFLTLHPYMFCDAVIRKIQD